MNNSIFYKFKEENAKYFYTILSMVYLYPICVFIKLRVVIRMSKDLEELKESEKKPDYRTEDLSEVFLKSIMEFNDFAKESIKKLKQTRIID